MAAKREIALAGIEVCDLAMEVAGGSAYFKGSVIERAYRDIRGAKLHPFTPEADAAPRRPPRPRPPLRRRLTSTRRPWAALRRGRDGPPPQPSPDTSTSAPRVCEGGRERSWRGGVASAGIRRASVGVREWTSDGAPIGSRGRGRRRLLHRARRLVGARVLRAGRVPQRVQRRAGLAGGVDLAGDDDLLRRRRRHRAVRRPAHRPARRAHPDRRRRHRRRRVAGRARPGAGALAAVPRLRRVRARVLRRRADPGHDRDHPLVPRPAARWPCRSPRPGCRPAGSS